VRSLAHYISRSLNSKFQQPSSFRTEEGGNSDSLMDARCDYRVLLVGGSAFFNVQIHIFLTNIYLLSEVPGAAQVNSQPALNMFYFVNSFQKCALQLLEFQAPRFSWPRSKLHQNLPWTGGDVSAKFHQDRCRGLDFHLPSTYQPTKKHTSMFIHIDFRESYFWEYAFWKTTFGKIL